MRRERRIEGRRIRRRRRIAARLDETARRMGLYLLPWQRDVAVAWIDGERPAVVRARRAGWSTLARVVERRVNTTRRNSGPPCDDFVC